MQPRLLRLLIVLVCLNLTNLPANAQTGRIVRLSVPDVSNFPVVQAYLSVHDSNGKFIHNLQPEQITINESGSPLPVIESEELQPGVQVVVAISPGLAFAIRNTQAVSRYDLIKEALSNWAISRMGTTTDDWSLIIGQESEISHSSDPSVFLNGLDSASTENRDNSASIDILARAVNLASDPTPRPGMAKTVLFITSAIDGDIEQAISDISNQAQQQDISISVWFVASRGAVISKSAQLLTALVNGSQGEIFSFSGEEAIPNPGEFLESIRYIYRISYSSKAGIDEVQQFRADVQFEDEIVQSNQLSFQVDLLPPEPALIAPPISIERTLAEHIESGGDNPAPNDTINIVDLVPGEMPLQVVFDFPDGRKRDLIRSALLVDGVLVAENLSAPFDLFVWDLRNYLSDQTVKIQVECTDVLGITGASLEIPVDIYVVRPERDPWYVIRKNSTTIILIILLLVGGLLFLALILAGKLRPFTQVAARRVPTKSFNHNLPEQPVETPTGKNHGWSNRIQQHSANSNPEAGAYLRRIETNSGDGIESVIAILQHEILFGSDPDQVDILIEEPCIDPIHARLEVLSEDKYWLYDMGSIGGTWVNYTPITDKGTMLATEDLIHFGRIGFKFVIRDTSSAIKPVIILETAQKSDTPKDPQEDSKENIS